MCMQFQKYPKCIVEIQGVPHTFKQLRQYLDVSKWFTDTILNQYLFVYQTHHRVEGTWICSSFEFETMQRNHNIGHLIEKFCSFSRLIMPLNTANHWLCAEFYPHHGICTFYDSLNTQNDHIKNVYNNFWKVMKSSKNWNFELEMKFASVPQQSDHDSCGIFCISNIKSLLKGLPLVDVTDELESVRQNILFTILEKKFE